MCLRPWADVCMASTGRTGAARDVEEAIDDLRQHVRFDDTRLWLTGTATGGHGVWQLATLEPARWAAIAPRNAWLSYRTFGGGLPSFAEPTHVEQMLLRAANTCDIAALDRNLAPCGVFLQHDPNDAVVPVEQSRQMREQLARFHRDFVYLEPHTGQASPAGDCAISPALRSFSAIDKGCRLTPWNWPRLIRERVPPAAG